MTERLAFSLALDLLFNGQNMDYCERPISLSILDEMALFSDLPPCAHIGVVGPGGGRLVRTLVERGFTVEAFEGRHECLDHLQQIFKSTEAVTIRSAAVLDDPAWRRNMKFDALFCMDDLRAFRENREWTEEVQSMILPGGYLVYSQVSNRLPSQRNTLGSYFDACGTYNVSEETAQLIRDSYLALEGWAPDPEHKHMAKETLDMMKAASGLRRSIMSGVEVRYVVWRRRKLER